MNKLIGKTALVTGSSGKIGESIINLFLTENIDKVIAIYNNTFINSTLIYNEKVLPYKCDLSHKENILDLYNNYLKNYDFDILINCAGCCNDSPFLDISFEDFKKTFDTNFWSAYHLIKLLIPNMVLKKYGKIVNISSTSSFGTINKSDYCASKAALDGLTRALAKEYSCNNITINSIQPSLINTDMLNILPDELLKDIINHTAIKRLGNPDEIANIVLFLSSDDSSYLNGENIIASGGSITRD